MRPITPFESALEEAKQEFPGIESELNQPAIGMSFKERLLLGLIQANLARNEPYERRLSEAMKVVFGEKQKRSTKDDHNGLLIMAQWYESDRHLAEQKKPRSDRQLAKGAARLTSGNATYEAKVDRLRKAFAKQRPALLAELDERAVERGVLHDLALYDLEDFLRPFGVKFVHDR